MESTEPVSVTSAIFSVLVPSSTWSSGPSRSNDQEPSSLTTSVKMRSPPAPAVAVRVETPATVTTV